MYLFMVVDYLNGYYCKIYGKDNFETIGDKVDLLKYKNAIHNNSLCIKT